MKRVGQVWDVWYGPAGDPAQHLLRRWLILEDCGAEVTVTSWHMNYQALDLLTGKTLAVREHPRGWEDSNNWQRVA
jgi:hypothetical protein